MEKFRTQTVSPILPSPDTFPRRILLHYESFSSTLAGHYTIWFNFFNIINICVFLKIGTKDNVTTLLFSFALSDLAFLILITPTVEGYILHALDLYDLLRFESGILLKLLYWPAFTAYDLSALIFVSLGLMRCACVAMPFKFKFIFTRSRRIQ